jgi:integrase
VLGGSPPHKTRQLRVPDLLSWFLSLSIRARSRFWLVVLYQFFSAGVYNRLLITVLLTTGLRDQELRHLCWSDLDLSERKLRVAGKPQYNWRIKSWEQRELPLSSELVTMLEGEAWRR